MRATPAYDRSRRARNSAFDFLVLSIDASDVLFGIVCQHLMRVDDFARQIALPRCLCGVRPCLNRRSMSVGLLLVKVY